MRLFKLIGALGLVLATVSGPAVAHHGCEGVVTVWETPAGVFYLSDRSEGDPSSMEFWIYQESNGKPGLQTGGFGAGNLYRDYCTHPSPDVPKPDLLVF